MRQSIIVLQQLQTFLQTAKKSETAEAELSKVEFKVNSCVEELAKMDQFAKVITVTIIRDALRKNRIMWELAKNS